MHAIDRALKICVAVLSCIAVVLPLVAGHASAEPRLSDLKPIILSYYWPVAQGQADLRTWNMETPNVVDVLKKEVHGSLEVRRHWQGRGKLILNRVHPFRQHSTEDDVYRNFSDNMQDADGIAIDELVDQHLDRPKSLAIISVLGRLRKAYPDKVIAVWGSRKWERNIPVLEAVRDYADLFIPEIYVSAKAARQKEWLLLYNTSLKDLEKKAPGILKKTIVGIGLHPAMRNEPGADFEQHILAQVAHLGTDPFLRQLRGIGLYAPVYLSQGEQKALDAGLRKYFLDRPSTQ